MTSEHYRTERESREYLIDFGIGFGHVVDDFVINRARPQQIQRYYTNVGEKAPAWLLTIAKQHNRLGYNKI